MQIKHLIIFALAGIVILIGFNIINSNRNENRIQDAASNAALIQSVTPDSEANNPTGVTSQPLGKQPKAIIDDVTSQVEQAQQLDQARVDQMQNVQ